MTNSRMKRLMSLFAMLAASAMLAAGCGGDDNDGGGDSGGGANPVGGDTQQQDSPSTDQPANRDEAAERCREEADKLEGQAKETAEAACESIESGDDSKLKEEAKQQCLDAAEQIPDEAARKQAENSCEMLTE